MRNSYGVRGDLGWGLRAAVLTAGWAATIVLGGCASDTALKQKQSAEAALQQKQYDQALANADEALKANATGPTAAEATYIRGVAYQERTKADDAAKSADLQQARTAYIAALKLSPPPPLEALIRAGLGTVAYFQDDYETAVGQLAAAYDKLEKPADKAGALYRLGVAQQRLGRFADADATFAQVQQKFPDREQAQWSRYHAGARTFAVRFGTFATVGAADDVARRLTATGLTAHRQPDANNRLQFVQMEVRDYNEARSVKARVAAAYPKAEIVP